jgi:hypothetical protein
MGFDFPSCVEYVMPRRVKSLLASWRGQLGSCKILEVWRIPLCLMCICIETQEALKIKRFRCRAKNIMFMCLYTWKVVYNSLHFYSFSEFLDFCSFSP